MDARIYKKTWNKLHCDKYCNPLSFYPTDLRLQGCKEGHVVLRQALE